MWNAEVIIEGKGFVRVEEKRENANEEEEERKKKETEVKGASKERGKLVMIWEKEEGGKI